MEREVEQSQAVGSYVLYLGTGNTATLGDWNQKQSRGSERNEALTRSGAEQAASLQVTEAAFDRRGGVAGATQREPVVLRISLAQEIRFHGKKAGREPVNVRVKWRTGVYPNESLALCAHMVYSVPNKIQGPGRAVDALFLLETHGCTAEVISKAWCGSNDAAE